MPKIKYSNRAAAEQLVLRQTETLRSALKERREAEMVEQVYRISAAYGAVKWEPPVYRCSVTTKRWMVEERIPLGVLQPLEIDNTLPDGEVHSPYAVMTISQPKETHPFWRRWFK